MVARHAEALLSIPGVVGVAAGERAGEAHVEVLVERWTPEMEDRIPPSIDSFPVEIRTTGGLQALEGDPADGVGPSGPGPG